MNETLMIALLVLAGARGTGSLGILGLTVNDVLCQIKNVKKQVKVNDKKQAQKDAIRQLTNSI